MIREDTVICLQLVERNYIIEIVPRESSKVLLGACSSQLFASCALLVPALIAI
ncbi:hypothetical protein Mapa_007250 [Marchantia paleacea]|nr:hypothetical protein Mapa_007250 [Marchantia paleacea]